MKTCYSRCLPKGKEETEVIEKDKLKKICVENRRCKQFGVPDLLAECMHNWTNVDGHLIIPTEKPEYFGSYLKAEITYNSPVQKRAFKFPATPHVAYVFYKFLQSIHFSDAWRSLLEPHSDNFLPELRYRLQLMSSKEPLEYNFLIAVAYFIHGKFILCNLNENQAFIDYMINILAGVLFGEQAIGMVNG